MTGRTEHDRAVHIADVASRFDDLTAEGQKAALELLLEQGPRFGVFPLTAAQHRLWFSTKMTEDLPLYNVPFAFRLAGELNASALRHAIGELIRRHEMLRAVFFDIAGEPFQAVLPTMAVPLQVRSWQPANATALVALVDAEAAAPFDLRHGPLIRVTLLTDGRQEHVFLITLHHIVCDGWSMAIIFRELGEFYRAFCERRPPGLAPLPGRFFEVAGRQEAGERTDRAGLLRYWRAQLAGAPYLLTLTGDWPRPVVAAHLGSQVVFGWRAELRDAVELFAAARQTTVFVTILAAFAAVLHRYTGQEDILIGVPAAGRSTLDAEDLVGFFVNTLALRLRLSAAVSFSELLGQAREVTLTAQAHQDLPFEILVESLQIPRTPSYHPLVQVFFIVQEAESEVLRLPGLSCETVQGHTGTSKFDLTLSLVASPHGFRGVAEYDTGLFGEERVERIIADLLALLTLAIADPEQSIGSLPLADRQVGR
jgi:hypothetical protein